MGMNNLETLLKCPVCQRGYARQSASVVRQNERFMLVYVGCKGCGINSLVIVSRGPFAQEGTLTMGFLTDLEKEEVDFFSHLNPISWDEVLDFHQEAKEL